jgi:hypothetical protein
MSERQRIKSLFKALERQPEVPFPIRGARPAITSAQGVYVIRGKDRVVVHVGRTVRGRDGLLQRIGNHIAGKSSFVREYLKGRREVLRDGCTYQFLEVSDDRQRALLEHYATAWHCPKHLGIGAARAPGK